MSIEDQIKDEKLQYGINREASKISALSSSKLDKYEYLTGEEILPSNKQQIIEQAKFTYSPLGKAFEKQTKTIEDQGEKQTKTIKDQGEKQIKAIRDKSIEKIKKYYKKIMIMIIKKNYYFQKKEKSLRIFTMTGSNNYNSRAIMLIIII